MSILQRYEHIGSDIGPQANNILREFSYTQRMSAYNIYKKFKLGPSKMAYKNAYKHVKRLQNLEFIEPIEVQNAERGAKYYRISEAGLFQLFLPHKLLIVLLPSIVKTHGNYLIFETFLYPIFKQETLVALKEFSDPYKTRGT